MMGGMSKSALHCSVTSVDNLWMLRHSTKAHQSARSPQVLPAKWKTFSGRWGSTLQVQCSAPPATSNPTAPAPTSPQTRTQVWPLSVCLSAANVVHLANNHFRVDFFHGCCARSESALLSSFQHRVKRFIMGKHCFSEILKSPSWSQFLLPSL